MMTRDSDDDGDVRQACDSVVQCSVVQCENEYHTDEMMTRDSNDDGDVRQACGNVAQCITVLYCNVPYQSIPVFTFLLT